MHGLAVAVFALLGLSGAGVLATDALGLALPTVITGAGGSLGALVLTWLILRRRAGVAVPQAVRVQQATRLSMALAALVAAAAGVAFAPDGVDRGFVITVSAVLAGALALFALLAGESPHRLGATGRRG